MGQALAMFPPASDITVQEMYDSETLLLAGRILADTHRLRANDVKTYMQASKELIENAVAGDGDYALVRKSDLIALAAVPKRLFIVGGQVAAEGTKAN